MHEFPNVPKGAKKHERKVVARRGKRERKVVDVSGIG